MSIISFSIDETHFGSVRTHLVEQSVSEQGIEEMDPA
jgi:hypothetical protein